MWRLGLKAHWNRDGQGSFREWMAAHTGRLMMGNDGLKKAHERAVGERFIRLYNCTVNRNFCLAELRERPDLEFSDAGTGDRLGVEIITGYYGQEHARRVWTDARGGREGDEPLEIKEPDASLVNRILTKIAAKLGNSFEYPHPLVLVVDLAPAQLTSASDFRQIVERLFFPQPPQYRGIYLLDWRDDLQPLYETQSDGA